MNNISKISPFAHKHVFLGDDHKDSESRTWKVIWLCGAMMILEIVGASGSVPSHWWRTGCI